MSVYRPQRAWVLLTILWLVCDLACTSIYLQDNRGMPNGHDWLMWIILFAIPPLLFWWAGIVFRSLPRKWFWASVASVVLIVGVVVIAINFPRRSSISVADVKWDNMP